VEVSTRIHCAVTPSLEVTHIVSNSFDNTRQLYTRLLSFLTNSRTPYINMADNGNPGNFANRHKEEVQNIASKGGQASHNGGFASMDADKQVCNCSSPTPLHCTHSLQREIASQGGKASSGSFEPGSEKAKEAGRKGGQSS
jgi:general stress protein YciG